MSDKLEELGLKTRTISALAYAKITSITTLLTKSKRDLRGVYGLGHVGIRDIEKYLGQKGLKLKTTIPRRRAKTSITELYERMVRLEQMIASHKQEALPFTQRGH